MQETKESSVGKMDAVCFGGFWIRVAAYLIDAAVLYLPLLLVLFCLNSLINFYFLGRIGSDMTDMIRIVQIGLPVFIVCVQVWLFWIYCAACESSPWQATVGKKVLGLKVVDSQGKRLSFWRATGRHFAKILSCFIMGVGFFMVGWNRKKRGLHDMVASTLVTRQNKQA